MKKQEFYNIDLPKWPGMTVVGQKVTKDQAKEILIRTLGYMSGNNTARDNKYQAYLFGVELPPQFASKILGVDDFLKEKLDGDWKKVHDYKNAIKEELGLLFELEYLCNYRVISAWIGGPHGWCDWNGNIFCNNYNIGKWPSIKAVEEEWAVIAAAFPYLDLVCTLHNGETGEDDAFPIIQFVVKNGKVKMRLPQKDKQAVPTVFNFDPTLFMNPDREVGCTYEQFVDAVDYCKSVQAQKNDQ